MYYLDFFGYFDFITALFFVFKLCSKKLSASIYSDSDSTDKEKTDNTASDSQNQTFRTKAALKEFNSHHNSAAGKATNRNNKDSSSLTTNQVKEKERLDVEIERLQDSYEQQSQQKGRKEKSAKTMKEKGQEKTEKERIQYEKAEKERLAKIEQERIEKEAAEKERIERLHNEKNDKLKDKKKRKEILKDFSSDLLVVPQRQAAKKASENMMRTQIIGSSKKEHVKEDEKKELPKELSKIKDRRESFKESTIKQKSKVSKIANKSMTQIEHSSSPLADASKEKDVKMRKSEKLDKDIIVAYVPQRQAAKKAAEHIKGLGKVVVTDTTNAASIPEEKQEKPMSVVTSTKSSQPSMLNKSNSKHYINYNILHSFKYL